MLSIISPSSINKFSSQSQDSLISSKIDIKSAQLSHIKIKTQKIKDENKILNGEKKESEGLSEKATEAKNKLLLEKEAVSVEITKHKETKKSEESVLSSLETSKKSLESNKASSEDKAASKEAEISKITITVNVTGKEIEQKETTISTKRVQISNVQSSLDSAIRNEGIYNSQLSSQISSKDYYDREKKSKSIKKQSIENSGIEETKKKAAAAAQVANSLLTKSLELQSSPSHEDRDLYSRQEYTERVPCESMPAIKLVAKNGVLATIGFGIQALGLDLITAPFRDSYENVTRYKYVLNAQKHKKALEEANEKMLAFCTEVNNLKDEAKTLGTDISNYNTKIAELEREILSSRNAASSAYQTKLRAQDSYNTVSIQANSDIANLQAQQREAHAKISKMREKIKLEQKERDEALKSADSLGISIIQTNKDISAKELELQNLKSLLSRKEKELSVVNDGISKKTTEAAYYKQKAEEAQGKIEENELEYQALIASMPEITSEADFESTAGLFAEQSSGVEYTIRELNELLEIQKLTHGESQEVSAMGMYSHYEHGDM